MRTLVGRLGEALCGAAILLVLSLLLAHAVWMAAALEARDAPAVLAGAFLGALAVDGLTGLVHWTCDTWGDERTPVLGPTLIYAFREHHRDPTAMLAHPWTSVNREPALAAAAALALLSLPWARALLEAHPLAYGFAWAFLAYGAAANQLHQWAHVAKPPRPVRAAQRLGLVLSPERHARHHRGRNDRAYCISTGWLNPLLDRVGFWTALERGIVRLTHATR